MRQDTLRKAIEPVTTLQHRHQATLAELVGKQGYGPTRRIGVWGTHFWAFLAEVRFFPQHRHSSRSTVILPAAPSFFPQHLYMRQDTLRKAIEPVTTLQH